MRFRRTNYTEQEFIRAVQTCYSVASVLHTLGLKATGGNYKLFYRRVKILNLDTSHFTGQGHLKGKSHCWNQQNLSDILIENSTYTNTNFLKKRLLKEGLLNYQCILCGISNWCNQPIVLQLDHINGNHFDNRLENLRLLCPNCHSQTETFTNKKKK